MFLLLYADDIFIFAESAEDLQTALNIFGEYCSEWKLSINVSKTKILVFSKRKYNNKKEFLLNNDTYLGLLFSYNGIFVKVVKIGRPSSKSPVCPLQKKL
jgi:hypothetical protein